MLGEKVREFNTTTNKITSISLNVASGIYFLTANTAGGGRYNAKVEILGQ